MLIWLLNLKCRVDLLHTNCQKCSFRQIALNIKFKMSRLCIAFIKTTKTWFKLLTKIAKCEQNMNVCIQMNSVKNQIDRLLMLIIRAHAMFIDCFVQKIKFSIVFENFVFFCRFHRFRRFRHRFRARCRQFSYRSNLKKIETSNFVDFVDCIWFFSFSHSLKQKNKYVFVWFELFDWFVCEFAFRFESIIRNSIASFCEFWLLCNRFLSNWSCSQNIVMTFSSNIWLRCLNFFEIIKQFFEFSIFSNRYK